MNETRTGSWRGSSIGPRLYRTVAVQWHPERLYADHPEHLALFKGLVASSGLA
jgi:hypothetical protein